MPGSVCFVFWLPPATVEIKVLELSPIWNLGNVVTEDMTQWMCEPQGHALLSVCSSVIDEVCPGLDPVKLVAKPGYSGPCLSFQTSLLSPLCSVMG